MLDEGFIFFVSFSLFGHLEGMLCWIGAERLLGVNIAIRYFTYFGLLFYCGQAGL